MINGNTLEHYTEPTIDMSQFFPVATNSQVQTISYEQDPEANIVEQYFDPTVNSQELIENGLPGLVGTGTGLSQFLDQVDMLEKETKPQFPLNYSMVENDWGNIENFYRQTRRMKRQGVVPETTHIHHPSLNFQMVLPQENRNSKFVYSKKNRLFIKPDIKFHFQISYKPNDDSVKFVRLMLVVPTNISKAVLRCENHAMKDFVLPPEKRYNVIHSDYPNVIYDGSKEGISADERLSLVFPLPSRQKGAGENTNVTETITIPISFVCQTSCTGRENVDVVCSLENSTEVLARTTMPVKICSCPKRDAQKEDEDEGYIPTNRVGRKRPMQQYSSGKRIGEGKRIKTEHPPNPEQNIPISLNHFISSPSAGLQFYKTSYYLFQGMLADQPEMRTEYEPIIRELHRKANELEARLSTINRTSH